MVTAEHMAYALHSIGINAFGHDNRAGRNGTLHRFSAIRNRKDDIIGLTMRVGRPLWGVADMITDIALEDELKDKSVLVLGGPGSGRYLRI